VQITAAAGPTENRITIGIRYAKAGTICIASSTGVIARWKRSLRPATTPSGKPTASERSTAASMSASVCMLSSQSPISAKDTNAARTISPARQPPKRQTMNVPAAIVPTQVSASMKSSSAATSQSAKARKPSRIAKKMFGFSAVRCSSSQSWAVSISDGSSAHVSAAGHG
jgi:hypothetical protein